MVRSCHATLLDSFKSKTQRVEGAANFDFRVLDFQALAAGVLRGVRRPYLSALFLGCECPVHPGKGF
jgi:hypothetical protein